jgi:DNA-binding CsgD family transcriptional regulator
MATSLQEELTDAVFRTTLEPDAWGDVMRLMELRFPSSAQTFYFLHRRQRQVRPVSLRGIEPRWRDSFNGFYFAPDNPWIRLTQRLHRPGIVRTNERLEQLLGEPGALYRSTYYNEWMRPQGFRYTIGNTLLADDDIVANITLLRSPDLATFDDGEVRAFEALSRQLTLALRISIKLERAQDGATSPRAFDELPQPVAFVDAQRQLSYANRAMELLLRAKRGLALRQGTLYAPQPDAQDRLAACVAKALAASASGAGDTASVPLEPGDPAGGVLLAVPMRRAVGHYLPSAPQALLMVTRSVGTRCPSRESLSASYGFTRSESRLAQMLVQGSDLRQAGRAMGIAYGTARAYLKAIFDKADVHSQGQLVAKVMREMP